jgi:hypothetical protein
MPLNMLSLSKRASINLVQLLVQHHPEGLRGSPGVSN